MSFTMPQPPCGFNAPHLKCSRMFLTGELPVTQILAATCTLVRRRKLILPAGSPTVVRGLRKLLLGTLIVIAALYAGICVLLFAIQRSVMYYPQPNANRDGMVPIELQTASGTVSVLTRPCPGQDAVLYFGGNGEDVSLDM